MLSSELVTDAARRLVGVNSRGPWQLYWQWHTLSMLLKGEELEPLLASITRRP